MSHAQKDQHLIFTKLSGLKEEFASAVRLFELDKTGESVRKTERVLSQMARLIDELAEGYREALYKNKFPHLAKDQENLSDKSPKALMDLLIRTERSLARLEKEINRVHKHPSKMASFIKSKWKPVSAWAAAVVLIFSAVRHQYHKHGLLGEYFNDTNLEMAYKKRIDRQIDFNWDFDSPYSKKDNFSIRWSGFLLVPEDGPVELSTISDDGVRLWIDGQLVLDDWTPPHPAKTDAVILQLTKGPHPLRLEFYEGIRQARMQLFWKKTGPSRESLQPEIIPAEYLVPYRKYLTDK